MSARLSVIVPIYNTGIYLQPCLESIARQTMQDLDVVMVDDGSTDDSATIAARFGATDPRFRLVQKPNGGLGSARNTGVDHAHGEFIAFVDSDDVLPAHAYEVLVRSLERTGSDFASGDVRRLTAQGTRPTNFLAPVFTRTRYATHVTKQPVLLSDRISVNKVWRRSFWHENSLRFPEGVLYEDTPVTIPAHFLARSVDVIDKTVYYWRVREGEDQSITQRRTDIRGLRDRVAACTSVSRFLAERGFTAEKAQYDRLTLAEDLGYFLNSLPRAGAAYRQAFLHEANSFLDQADLSRIDELRAIDRLKWHLVRHRLLDELLQALEFQSEDLASVPPIRRRGRWYGDYPFREDRRLRIPRKVYELGEEIAPVWRIERLTWRGGLLHIEGFAYLLLLGAPTAGAQTVKLLAKPVGAGGPLFQLPTRLVHRPDVTADSTQQVANLDWSGFVATLDPAALGDAGVGRKGLRIGVDIKAGVVSRTTWDTRLAALRPARSVGGTDAGGRKLVAEVTGPGALIVRRPRAACVVRSCRFENGVLQLDGDIHGDVVASRLTVTRRLSPASISYPLFVDETARPRTWQARLPLDDLLHELDVPDRESHAEQQAAGVVWEVWSGDEAEREAKRVLLPTGIATTAWEHRGRDVALHRNRYGSLSIIERTRHAVLTDVDWVGGELRLAGSMRGAAGDYQLVMSARGRSQKHTVDVHYLPAEQRFEVNVPVTAMTSVAGTLPLRAGMWDLQLRRRDHTDDIALTWDHDRLPPEPACTIADHKEFRLGVGGHDGVLLEATVDLDVYERGGYRQRDLQTTRYPQSRRKPPRAAVLYDWHDGRGHTGSPRAVHEELVRRAVGLEHLWVVDDGACEVPPTARAVRRGSADYYDAYARARYLISYGPWPEWFTRRSEQTCLQTWPATPVKRVGRELADRPPAYLDARRVARQRPVNWQYVVSGGPAFTGRLQQALPVAGTVLETGSPSTDLIVRLDAAAVTEAVRRRLHIPADHTIVLYAPTFRDQLRGPKGRFRRGPLPDVDALRRGLSGHVLLVRLHPDIADALGEDDDGFVRDVTAYPEVAELLVAADVLVTDYSSLAVDFAATGKPMLFYVPDLATYRDEVRGLAIDLESEAPGPLLASTEDLLAALGDLKSVQERHAERYARFAATYAPLADGNAASRVVDRLFGG